MIVILDCKVCINEVGGNVGFDMDYVLGVGKLVFQGFYYELLCGDEWIGVLVDWCVDVFGIELCLGWN